MFYITKKRRASLSEKKRDRAFSMALAGSSVFYGAIMMQNDPIKMKDSVIKSKKGLRS